MAAQARTTPLHTSIGKDPAMQRGYAAYTVDESVTSAIAAARPMAHMVVVYESWCGDSRRLAPRMARILDYLPGWTVAVMPWKGETRRAPYAVTAIPTFIVYDSAEEGRRELGRIVERIKLDSLEEDLLSILS